MDLERLNLTADNPREQIIQIRSYLLRIAEQLEFILDNMDEKNLSAPFLKRLDGLDESIAKIHEEMETRQQALVIYVDKQIAALNSATTTDTTTEGE